MSLRIDVCGIPFSTGTVVDEATWVALALKDWGSPSYRSDLSYPTGRAGAALGFEAHGEHTFSIEGRIRSQSKAAVERGANRLNRMPGVGASGLVIVYEQVPKQITVKQGDRPQSEPAEVADGGWRVDFQLTFTSLDPYKRGLEQRTAHLGAVGSVSVTNAGNVPALLTFTTTGAGIVSIRQDESGQILKTRSIVGNGTVFDGQNRRVTTAGGVDIFPMGAPSEWLAIPAESTVTLTSLGTAPVDVSWFDPYA